MAALMLTSVALTFPAGHPARSALDPWSHRAAPAIAYLVGDIAATEHQLGLTPRMPVPVVSRLAADVLAARSIGPPPDAGLAGRWMQALNRLWAAVGQIYAGDGREASGGLVSANQQLLGISLVLGGGG